MNFYKVSKNERKQSKPKWGGGGGGGEMNKRRKKRDEKKNFCVGDKSKNGKLFNGKDGGKKLKKKKPDFGIRGRS